MNKYIKKLKRVGEHALDESLSVHSYSKHIK